MDAERRGRAGRAPRQAGGGVGSQQWGIGTILAHAGTGTDPTTGATLDPLSSFLLLRGLKTLALRMERHEANARAVAAALEADPRVTRVLYPGRSGMVSFELAPGADVGRFLAAVRVFTFAESLGGVESLVTCPAVQTHADVPREVRESYGLTDQLLRLSVGIEDAEDLVADLRQALAACDG